MPYYSREVTCMADQHKENKGNDYKFNDEFAEEVLEKNNKHTSQNNPPFGNVKKK
jgi:hypothetical protein